jgi:hypothetical protein
MNRKGFTAIFIRLFIDIYVNQTANVRWNSDISSEFPMTNGCRQGAILSAIAYCFYCEDLFAVLRQKRAGCWVLDTFHGIFGYSDDNWILAPSLGALQDMLQTCEEYAASHNLRFSTDPDPTKCKTKLMAFLRKPRTLPSLSLCGNPLPWVNKVKHLGNTIGNVMDGCKLDLKTNNARYIEKNNSINQELYFAHPQTKFRVNSIYNSHFTGSQLWEFGSREMEKLETTYNKSIKIMFNLPWATHRNLIEPLTGMPHIRRILIWRYLSFIKKIQKSKKTALTNLLNLAMNDVRTTTGSNLRWIMLHAGNNTIDEVLNSKVDVEYHKLDEEQLWRAHMLRELIDVRNDVKSIEELENDDLEDILEFLCTE